MARRTPALAAVGSQEDTNILRFDEAPEFGAGHEEDGDTPIENMEQQVKEAQQRLALLRAQQEEVERQKQILETLRQKQERFVTGKRDMTEKLERCMRAISDELDEARRRVENLAITQQDFVERMDELKTFLPERWHRSQLETELDRALTSLDEAEACYEKGVRRLQAAQNARTVEQPALTSHYEASEEGASARSFLGAADTEDFKIWARRGLAFTLPLMVAGLVGLLFAKLLF